MKNVAFGKQESERVIYFDCLRIIATLAVMVLHIAAQNWHSVDVTSFEWQIFNIFDSIVRWSVPIFVMISGALFLERHQSIKEIYSKNVLRIITAFLFWSAVYSIVSFLQGSGIKSAAAQFIQGHYHMWFLYMIVGLYLIVPFIKKITESEELIKYFLALAIFFSFVIPQGINILTVLSSELGEFADSINEIINFHFTLGYVSYFLCGYYLSKVDLSSKARKVIYLLSILGFTCTIVLSAIASIFTNTASGLFYGNFTVNVMLESVGIFVFFKYNIPKISLSKKRQRQICMLSKYSFGAYLVHAMVIEQLNHLLGLNTLLFNPVLSIIGITAIVFMISFSVSFVLNQIPIIKTYVV